MQNPVRDERTWWLVIELDGKIKHTASITVSGREHLMNNDPASKLALLAARFDEAVRKVRDEFLTKNA